MNKHCLIWLALAMWPLASPGQTNSSLELRRWFATPSLQLRPFDPEPGLRPGPIAVQPGAATNLQPRHITRSGSASILSAGDPPFNIAPPATGAAPLTATLDLGASASDSENAFARHLVDAGYLTRIEPPPDSPFLRRLNAIFEPTPVKLGHTEISCTIITAIKRRNPLCLLNPIIFQAGW